MKLDYLADKAEALSFDDYIIILKQNTPEVLLKIFGTNFDDEFYISKSKELTALLELQWFSIYNGNRVVTSIHSLQLKSTQITELPEWEIFRSSFYNEFRYLEITEVLYEITKLDIRLAVVLAYMFGLITWCDSNLAFQEYFGVTKSFLQSNPGIALLQLIESLKYIDHEKPLEEKAYEVRDFLHTLLNFDSRKFIKYSNGNLVPFNSVLYNFGKFLSGEKLNYKLLSFKQRKLYDYYYRYFQQYKVLPTSEHAEQALNIPAKRFEWHMARILEVSEAENKFVKRAGNLMPIDDDSIVLRVLDLVKVNPDCVNNPNLSERQRQCIQIIINTVSPDSPTIVNLNYLGIRIGMSGEQMFAHLNDVFEKINDQENYYDKDGTKLRTNDIRVQLITRGGLEYINTLNIRQNNKKIIELILELQPNSKTFKYSYDEVAKMLGIKTRNPAESIYYMAKFALEGKNDFDPTLVDEFKSALRLNHLVVVELLLKHGIKPLLGIKPERYLDIAKLLLETNEEGLYYCYEVIAEKIGCAQSVITDAVKKIIRTLENIES